MSESRSFSHVCEKLEASTGLGRLEARGTVRLALKKAGLDAATVGSGEMAVLVEKVLPAELRARGIDAADAICSELRASLAALPKEQGAKDTAASVFARLGGDAGR